MYITEKAAVYRNSIKIIHSPELADIAANTTVDINGTLVNLCRSREPNATFVTKTIHLYDMPFEVDDERVKEFLIANG